MLGRLVILLHEVVIDYIAFRKFLIACLVKPEGLDEVERGVASMALDDA